MDLGLRNKVAFVGASSQGLGKSVAMEFASEGASVVICGRNTETLKAAEAEVKTKGGAVLALAGDLSIALDREYFIQATLRTFGRVDILVTNTGGPPTGKFEAFVA